ncbi:hypothetical protein U9M48_011560 [Paspalum notatum var. saurae]|uniref:F-box domain-containing protein n=1 Tax=Paspalum notatum var. saurae TaxID=547442 RepID=A0AAQ3SXR4_PASNO
MSFYTPAPPPELMDELVEEILLRLPPDEPEHLFRATLVFKPWLRALCDPAFLRRYRTFHRAPPLLGLLHRLKLTIKETTPTASPPPRRHPSLPTPTSAAGGGGASTAAMGAFSSTWAWGAGVVGISLSGTPSRETATACPIRTAIG